MIVLDLAYWNLRWRPWRELALLQHAMARPVKRQAGDDVILKNLPGEFLKERGEYLD